METEQQKKQKKKIITGKNCIIGILLYAIIVICFLVWGTFNSEKAADIVIKHTPVYHADIESKPTDTNNEETISQEPEMPSIPQKEEQEVIEQDTPPAEMMAEEAPTTEEPVIEEQETSPEPEPEPTPIAEEPEHEEKIDNTTPTSYNLTPAPADGLFEKNSQGHILPRKAKDGREPWRVYARPFNSKSKKPRISIIVSDMGLSTNSTERAIMELPPEITLAYVPYAGNLEEWVKKTRANGHEVILSVPMEPETYPKDDPGPNALLTSLSRDENISRFHWALSRASGYVGIMNFMGSRFTTNTDLMSALMDDIRFRGLMIVDAASTTDSVIPSLSRIHGVPYSVNDRYIDNIASRQSIDKQLKSLEEIARRRGHAIGIAFPYPITFERLKKWVATLDKKGIELAPITAVASEEIE